MTKNIFGILILLLSFSLFGNERYLKKKEIEQILIKVDQQYRSKSSHTELEMKIETKNWKRTMSLEMWTKGMSKTLIHIKSPKKDAGITTLRVEKSMWNYFPKINKTIKVPPSMMMGSWMGSDFTNDDLVKESTFIEDYKYKMIQGESSKHYYIELIPKAHIATVWGKIHLVISIETKILEKQLSYNERGELVRTIEFTDIQEMGGKVIPVKMTIISHKKQSNKTIINYKKAKFNTKIKDSVFSKRNLQRRR